MDRPLSGIRVVGLEQYMAGPYCTMLLADAGAEVVKIERPGAGDDTRKWGPPYIEDEAGRETEESAYYLASNRNKRSLTLDISKPEGQALAKRLIGRCDILIENFKAGTLPRYGSATTTSRATIRSWSIARSPASARPGPTRRAPATTTWPRAWAA